ncbi:MAG: hypothetical protein KBD78_10330 [Oligoflexales bacterium]|nr:hypothetical protein [Oligoflexales bacterium]
MKYISFMFGVLFLTLSCAHLEGGLFSDDKNKKITLESDMPLEELLTKAIEGDADVVAQAIEIINYRKEWANVGPILNRRINKDAHKLETPQLINTFKLYIKGQDPQAPQLFERIVAIDNPSIQRFAWSIAARMPSKSMAEKIDQHLNEIIKKNDIGQYLFAEMAIAIDANQIKSAFSLLSLGLFEKNEVEFAKAMARLDARAASDRFMVYLSKAGFEELRQLHFSTVDLNTCLFILQHMQKQAPGVDHPQLAHLFYYAVSRNRTIGDLAHDVILSYVVNHQELIAFTLSGLPTEVQLAFVETARRTPNALTSQLLKSLMRLSSRQEVIDELREVNF